MIEQALYGESKFIGSAMLNMRETPIAMSQ
jgi:hypothetical protein